ncbi:hypothetical protein DXG03_001993 [Asterophora parasitica]|uniref:Cytochrome P450 n=1 Tax=Asterophora parasitica TaxID=117018 RepID=A0A9P7GH34_9AGAR|nr:hypothetical protein DXG03_001993 [Asterophora parasitica]
MVLYPDVQRKARDEIVKVVGRGRLPDFKDRDKLPYIEALLQELLRWNPVAPLVSTLAAFEITNAIDKTSGLPIVPVPNYKAGVIW